MHYCLLSLSLYAGGVWFFSFLFPRLLLCVSSPVKVLLISIMSLCTGSSNFHLRSGINFIIPLSLASRLFNISPHPSHTHISCPSVRVSLCVCFSSSRAYHRLPLLCLPLTWVGQYQSDEPFLLVLCFNRFRFKIGTRAILIHTQFYIKHLEEKSVKANGTDKS